jgi:hypothetical protein
MSDPVLGNFTYPAVKTGIIEESPGVKTSKRFWGSILLGVGGLLIVALGVYSIFKTAADPDTVKSCGIALIVVGGGLLGITVFEGISEVIGKLLARKIGGAS